MVPVPTLGLPTATVRQLPTLELLLPKLTALDLAENATQRLKQELELFLAGEPLLAAQIADLLGVTARTNPAGLPRFARSRLD